MSVTLRYDYDRMAYLFFKHFDAVQRTDFYLEAGEIPHRPLLNIPHVLECQLLRSIHNKGRMGRIVLAAVDAEHKEQRELLTPPVCGP